MYDTRQHLNVDGNKYELQISRLSAICTGINKLMGGEIRSLHRIDDSRFFFAFSYCGRRFAVTHKFDPRDDDLRCVVSCYGICDQAMSAATAMVEFHFPAEKEGYLTYKGQDWCTANNQKVDALLARWVTDLCWPENAPDTEETRSDMLKRKYGEYYQIVHPCRP